MGIFDGLSEKQKEAVETIDEDLEMMLLLLLTFWNKWQMTRKRLLIMKKK